MPQQDLPPLPTLPITSAETLRKCRQIDCLGLSAPRTIFIGSFPKSGTTWMQNIVYQLVAANRRCTQDDDEADLPLEHISQYAPFYKIDPHWESTDAPVLVPKIRQAHEALKCRIFNTHLRRDMLPDGAKYIYVVRDGRDVLTSFYHHMTNQHPDDGGFQGNFEEFFQQFLDGSVAYGKWSHHLMSWMPHVVGEKQNGGKDEILLVRYEVLKDNLPQQVIRIANFLELVALNEKTTDASYMEPLLERMTFEWMRDQQHLFHPISVRWKPGYHFIRKGTVGDHDTIFNDKHKSAFMESILSDFEGKGNAPRWLMEHCFHK